MIEWEYYNPDTYTMQDGDMLGLVKELTASEFVFVVGTLNDALCSGKRDTLQDAKAACVRYIWTVKNLTLEQADRLCGYM